MRPLEFRLLGPLEVLDGDRALALGGGQQRALLAVLLLHANEVVSTDRLIDELWGDDAAADGRQDRAGLRLAAAQGARRRPARHARARLRAARRPAELDLARFEQLVGEAQRCRSRAARPRRCGEALALWRGPALADLAYEPFAQAEIARLEELRWAALEERIDADLALGRHAELVGELEALVAEHPLRERLRGQLMLALYRSGRQAEALERLPRSAQRELADELGLEPSAALQAARAGDPAPGPGARPRARARRPRAGAVAIAAARAAALGGVDSLARLAEPLAASSRRAS